MDSTTCKEEDAFVDASLFILSQIFSRVLDAAIRLDLFGIIAKQGPGAYISANSIASKLGAQNLNMIDRMLRLFASHSLLSYKAKTLTDGRVETVYGLTPASEFLVNQDNAEASLPRLGRLTNTMMYDMGVWTHLEDIILEGGDLFNRKLGMPLFEYMNKDPEFNTIFNEAMASGSAFDTKTILDAYKGFAGIKSLIDVGGGTGKTLNNIISKYPSINGINFDLPHVVQTAPQYPGIQHIGGNMFDSIPKGDAIMIKRTCHNWSDENALLILRNIYEALPIGGKLIVIEIVRPDQPDTSKSSRHASTRDILMQALFEAKERSAFEFRALIEAAGFTNFHVAFVAPCTPSVMEAFK